MKRLVILCVLSGLLLRSAFPATLTLDMQGNVLNTTPTNFPTAKLKVDGVIVDPTASGVSAWDDLDFTNSNLADILTRNFADLQNKPTTIAGYGITDFNSLGDARWSLLAHTHIFASLTSKPTTIGGYGITDFNSLGDARWQPIGSYESPLTFSPPLTRTANAVSLPAASASMDGYLDRDDFAVFEAKVDGDGTQRASFSNDGLTQIGMSGAYVAVLGTADSTTSPAGYQAIHGIGLNNASAFGAEAQAGNCYDGDTVDGYGVIVYSATGDGVYGQSGSGVGLRGQSTTGKLLSLLDGSDVEKVYVGQDGVIHGDGSGLTGVGDMLKADNLSGLANYTTARSNLGLGTAATTAATDYATSAQGTKADNAGAINGILKSNGSASFSAVTDNSSNWDTAYTDRLKWDGGATGLTAATGRTSLGATTVGGNIFTLTNPGAITFLRLNADNTVDARTASQFRGDIGAGTGSGDALVANPLSQFASTTSAQLRTVLSDELGTGAALFDGATPTALTLTNATGLPISGITASTSIALGVGSIELGHATDTTLSRASAGKLAVEGVNVAMSGSNSDITALTGSVQATAAQAIAHSSTSTVISPATSPFSLFGWNWHDFYMVEINAGTNVGTGSTSTAAMDVNTQSGTTASSGAIRSVNIAPLYPGASVGGLNFSKPVGFAISFDVRSTAPANGRARFALIASSAGAGTAFGNTAGTIGQPLKKAIGVEVQQNAIYAAVHDGTTYTTTTLSQNAANDTPVTVMAIGNTGSWDYYVNGVFAATVTGGPSGSGTTYTAAVLCAVENNASAANMNTDWRLCKVFQALQ